MMYENENNKIMNEICKIIILNKWIKKNDNDNDVMKK